MQVGANPHAVALTRQSSCTPRLSKHRPIEAPPRGKNTPVEEARPWMFGSRTKQPHW